MREIHGVATGGCCAQVVMAMRTPFDVCRRVWEGRRLAVWEAWWREEERPRNAQVSRRKTTVGRGCAEEAKARWL